MKPMRASRDEGRLIASLIVLTFVTGIIDAASVLGLGHVFTANMTGNVAFLGFALGGAHDVSIAASLIALGGFLCGAAYGGRLVRKDALGALPLALVLEIALLVAGAVVAGLAGASGRLGRSSLLVLLSVPMGLQNAAVRRLAVPDLTTTVLTLTLTGIAADSSLAGGDNPRVARRWGAVVAMLAGAVVGAMLLRRGLVWTISAAVVGDAIALGGVLPLTVAGPRDRPQDAAAVKREEDHV
jgi:uncharacterized membrane protein YoaK (UPF0700 family)